MPAKAARGKAAHLFGQMLSRKRRVFSRPANLVFSQVLSEWGVAPLDKPREIV
jgi:hypothetical protein